MLTKKKQAGACCWVVAASCCVLLTGCSRSGSDALLDGARLLDRGQAGGAVRELREAVSLLPTNAIAWGYLGLAYHQEGSVSNAVSAYTRALALSPNLGEVRFNLGCLWMEQGQWGNAREQFAAATLLNKSSAQAWRWLGEAQLRLGETAMAVQSLGESLRVNAEDADTWNWLGLAQMQQGRLQEAERSFRSALRIQANHGPSMLNLAILNQQKLKNPAKALELYHQYLAFLPNAANTAEVRGVATDLEATLKEASKPATAVRIPVTMPPINPEPQQQPAPKKPAVASVPVQTNPATVAARDPVIHTPAPEPRPAAVRTEPRPDLPPEKVRVSASPPVARTVADPNPKPSSAQMEAERSTSEEPTMAPTETEGSDSSKKRGFFAKINPLNLFKKNKREIRTTPLPEPASRQGAGLQSTEDAETRVQPARTGAVPATVDVADADRFTRYAYRLGEPPVEGNAQAAEVAFTQAEMLRQRGRIAEALQYYRRAVKADPSHFAAQFNLGLLSLQSGDFSLALASFEAATRIDPSSGPARYNFALALKNANYPIDSANELLILLSQDPDDAAGHLILGNLYAQQFGDKSKARDHYDRVLELAPTHPEAGAIRFWLVENPR